MLSGIPGIEIVAEAQNVPEALLSIDLFQPDAVILDIQMPGGSGIDVLRDIKARHASTVVIVLTNHPYPQYRQKCAELGAEYFFSKSAGSKAVLNVCALLAKAWTGEA